MRRICRWSITGCIFTGLLFSAQIVAAQHSNDAAYLAIEYDPSVGQQHPSPPSLNTYISPGLSNYIYNASAAAATNATNSFDATGAAAAATNAFASGELALATNNFGNSVAVNMTNTANQFRGTFTNGTYYGNGGGLTNVGGTASSVKSFFTSNYTVLSSDSVLFCGGTNQLINTTNVTSSVGKYLSFYPVTTNGSVIVTNGGGVHIGGQLSQAVYYGSHLTIISDGTNWYQ